jgi:hypothetical protein
MSQPNDKSFTNSGLLGGTMKIMATAAGLGEL